MLTGLAVFAVGAYFTSHLFAQPGAPAQPQTQAGTKVACVNVGDVFNKYKRAIAFKADLDKTVEPFKAKGKKLVDEIKQWQEAASKPTADQKTREQAEQVIKSHKRELEDMQYTIQKMIGERQKSNMMTLWSEINMGIKAVSESAGYSVVLAYGDPVEKDDLVKFDN